MPIIAIYPIPLILQYYNFRALRINEISAPRAAITDFSMGGGGRSPPIGGKLEGWDNDLMGGISV